MHPVVIGLHPFSCALLLLDGYPSLELQPFCEKKKNRLKAGVRARMPGGLGGVVVIGL